MRGPFPGACTCGRVRFALTDTPLFIHACHCTWCQRETGSAFVLNGIIEASKVVLTGDDPVPIRVPSDSGDGQIISRCPTCQIALWSIYPGAGPRFLFVRMGTLDNTHLFPPDIHIFTSSKQPWVPIPDGAIEAPHYYDRAAAWPATSLARRTAHLALSDADAIGPRRT